jgi:hypothetical protein
MEDGFLGNFDKKLKNTVDKISIDLDGLRFVRDGEEHHKLINFTDLKEEISHFLADELTIESHVFKDSEWVLKDMKKILKYYKFSLQKLFLDIPRLEDVTYRDLSKFLGILSTQINLREIRLNF